jgi:septal ring factor EnvC (AmiA/AmiB activator)
MTDKPENLNTHHLRQFREELQAGFASLRTDIAAVRQEQASTTTKLEAMAQTLVGVQRDIRSLQASVAMLGVAVDGHTHRLDEIEKRLGIGTPAN